MDCFSAGALRQHQPGLTTADVPQVTNIVATACHITSPMAMRLTELLTLLSPLIHMSFLTTKTFAEEVWGLPWIQEQYCPKKHKKTPEKQENKPVKWKAKRFPSINYWKPDTVGSILLKFSIKKICLTFSYRSHIIAGSFFVFVAKNKRKLVFISWNRLTTFFFFISRKSCLRSKRLMWCCLYGLVRCECRRHP